MAAYAASVTLKHRVSHRLIPGMRIIFGSINLSNYNTTLAEITAITGAFRAAPAVILGGNSSNGYLVAWDSTSKAVKAWYPTQQTASTGNRAGVEVANDVAVGAVDFIAIGTD